MLRISLLFIVLILCQCTSDKYSEHREGETWVRVEGDLPEKERLTGVPFGIEKFYSTRKPFLVDGHIIVSDKAMSPPLHVIDVKNRKWAYGLGVEGYGPGEISYIWTFDYSSSPGKFWAYNFDKVFSEFTLEDSTAKLAGKQLKQRNPEFIMATDITWLTDTTLMGIRVSGEEKFVEYSKEGEVLDGYGSWKEMLPGDPPLNVAKAAFAMHFTSNQSKSKFGFFSMDRDHFEVLDYATKEILVVEGPYFEVPEYTVEYRSADDPYYYMNDPEAVRTYQDSFLGEDNIYMLYSGEKVSKIISTGLVESRTVFVFDYNGNMMRQFELDTPIKHLTVDEENQILYGLSSEENQDIVEFKF
ncbi:hypothetical protein KI659_09720 [Litoribacter alkaliphilus]|uniref:TolB-like 6-blade propeller-like n=1 Tax=Litoribacter ruber TaxID=702568 RepID=A0AAP2CLX5_9BACT|nr:BF3164 family lipoprotein [Litoribacter alkaliphilus]MBS9524292.1 hypothetical protein [Litoribacter alkaliphilus]